jgi:hypothetical protein
MQGWLRFKAEAVASLAYYDDDYKTYLGCY